jgi:hypothetical protein
MAEKTAVPWNGDTVRRWLESRIAASRLDQAAAQRGGSRREEDECDKASAEEMVCSLLLQPSAMADQTLFAASLRALLDRDEYRWRGVYDDTRFDRHARTCLRKIVKMTKTNEGFERTGRYQ